MPPPRNRLLQPQPGVKRHLDGILHTFVFEQIDNFLAEKRSIHAHLEYRTPCERGIQLCKQLLQKLQGSLAIVHVACPVANPQDLPRVGFVSGNRVIARHLAPMGIVTPARAFYLKAGGDY